VQGRCGAPDTLFKDFIIGTLFLRCAGRSRSGGNAATSLAAAAAAAAAALLLLLRKLKHRPRVELRCLNINSRAVLMLIDGAGRTLVLLLRRVAFHFFGVSVIYALCLIE
jgi:hypothetical protein